MNEEISNTADAPPWRLALVSTPIGNLEDITFRALRVLKEADLIAAEDTRRTAGLCRHYGIKTKLISYHAHNEHKKTADLIGMAEKGLRVAVVTDSGTPAVSDPGYLLVREAVRRGLEPEVIPGPSALTYCAVACGLPVDRFQFCGFPPRKAAKRRSLLLSLKDCDSTVFFFESVHRIDMLLCDILDVLGGDTELAVIREATKIHEERIRGCAADICRKHTGRNWKGELVVAVNLRTPPGARHTAVNHGLSDNTRRK